MGEVPKSALMEKAMPKAMTTRPARNAAYLFAMEAGGVRGVTSFGAAMLFSLVETPCFG